MSFLSLFAISTVSLLFSLIILIFNQLGGFYLLIGVRIIAEQIIYMGYKGNSSIILGLYGIFIIFISIIFGIFKKDFKVNTKPIIPFYFFLFTVLLSACFSDNLIEAATMFLKLLCLPAIFLLSYNLIDSEIKIEKSLRYLTFTSIVPIVYGFYQLLTGTGQHIINFWGQSEHRIFSTFAHANQYAFYLAIIALALVVLVQIKSQRRVINLLLLVLVLISILFTFSRSVWFTLTSCIGFSIFFFKRLRVPIIIIGTIFILLLSPIIIQGLANIINKEKGQINSVDFRISVTTQLLKNAVPERPFLGFGPGSSIKLVGKYTQYQPIVPHNDYMRILVESGFIGLFSFTLFLFYNFFFVIKNIKHIKENHYLAAIFVMLIFFSTILIGTNHIGNISTSGIWFLLFGILHKGFELRNTMT